MLYTVRNGSIDDKSVGVPFCRKVHRHCADGQRLTNHYHVAKTEDIINRAGGTLRLYLWNVDPATGKMLDTDVQRLHGRRSAHLQTRRQKCWWSRATASR